MAATHGEVKNVIMVLLSVTLTVLIYFEILNRAQMAFINTNVLSSLSPKFADLCKIRKSDTETANHPNHNVTVVSNDKVELELILSKAANPSKTVIITSLNAEWAQNNSMIDLFLQSFRVGNGTKQLLKYLLIVAVDNKVLHLCRQIHQHCYLMKTEGIDLSAEKYSTTDDYVKMMWRRLRFFGQVLEAGYNFVFTDTDILWFRDPFKKFSPSADMQISSDYYSGYPRNLKNSPNGGFMYVRSNPRTVGFFRFWYQSKATYPGKNEQEVLNFIKFQEITRRGIELIFLDTKHFRGYCQRNPDLSLVYTMHANCCRGVKEKLNDLRNTLSNWEKYMMNPHPQVGTKGKAAHWTPLQKCLQSWRR